MRFRSLVFSLGFLASLGACADDATGEDLDARNDEVNTGTAPAAAPGGLTCLAKHFGGTPESTAQGWALRFPSGAVVPWEDGADNATKTYEEKLEKPDLQDTLSIAYRSGPIVPVNTLNDDPGRIRVDELYRSAYGDDKRAVERELVRVDFLGQRVSMHKKAAPALEKVAARLKTAMTADPSLKKYLGGELGGSFNWRFIAGTQRLSAHSFATAIDIVTEYSDYWKWANEATLVWKNRIPQAIVDAFEAEGFAWGGRWYHYDTMHFEYRPELFDPACKP